MHEDILKELYKTFDLKARQGLGGKVFKFVPTSDIVDRMNKTFKGEWSTELISSEVIEDQILVLVRVHVREEGQAHFHDGYASQLLSRYTSGTNAGKVIDLGNSYRSAMSKAIKTAVAKWGVGLYLEGEETDDTTQFPTTDTPTPVGAAVSMDVPITTSSPNSAAPMAIPMTATPLPDTAPPADITGPVADPITNSVQPPAGLPRVDTSTGPTAGPPLESPPLPVPNNNPTGVEAGFSPPINTSARGVVGENLTDVQKVAIETIMSVHSLTFQELNEKALQRTTDLPPSLNEVGYSDAVKMIQFGNNLRPGQPA